MTYNPKENNLTNIESNYQCVKCGECCRAGYKIFITKDDFIDWDKNGKAEILDHIKIDPKCISLKISNEHLEKDGKGIIKIKRKNLNESYKIKLRELIIFVQKNHFYHGKEYYPLDYFTIMPNMRYNPILIPKSFDIVLRGLKRGLNYIIKLDSNGSCPFLNLNLCLIQEYKPKACKRFPYDNDGRIKEVDYFSSLCMGLKKWKKQQ